MHTCDEALSRFAEQHFAHSKVNLLLNYTDVIVSALSIATSSGSGVWKPRLIVS
jgi:hypothetical protein